MDLVVSMSSVSEGRMCVMDVNSVPMEATKRYGGNVQVLARPLNLQNAVTKSAIAKMAVMNS